MKTQLIMEMQVAQKMAEGLYALMREDSARRLQLHAAYGAAADSRWTPDFQRRIELSESLCRRLENILSSMGATAGPRPAPIAVATREKEIARREQTRLVRG